MKCISDLYYKIGDWFTILMLFIAFLFLPITMSIWDSFVSFFMCAGIAFVGVASHYRDKFEAPIHCVGAWISAICAVVWTYHVSPWHLLILSMALIGLVDRKRWLLWGELGCFFMIVMTILGE